jgi:hypothetical protein
MPGPSWSSASTVAAAASSRWMNEETPPPSSTIGNWHLHDQGGLADSGWTLDDEQAPGPGRGPDQRLDRRQLALALEKRWLSRQRLSVRLCAGVFLRGVHGSSSAEQSTSRPVRRRFRPDVAAPMHSRAPAAPPRRLRRVTVHRLSRSDARRIAVRVHRDGRVAGRGELRDWQRAHRDWLAANDACRRDILHRLDVSGPLTSRELPDTCAVPCSTGWTNNRNVTRLLDVIVAARRGRRSPGARAAIGCGISRRGCIPMTRSSPGRKR